MSHPQHQFDADSFCRMIAHELQGSLRVIEGFSKELLKDAANADADQDTARRILSVSRQAIRRLDALLQFARPSSAIVERSPVDLSCLAREIADVLASTSPSRHVTFVIQPDVICHGNPELLRVALSNLIENAWKFTSLRIDARIEFGQASSDEIPTYFVRDNGVGLSAADIQKLFRPFGRLHPENGIPGHGLGLSIVASIIERNGGRIWADSQSNGGAAFFFTVV
jgi:signal transduction histidine kinase